MSRIVVDLPAPFGPRNPVTIPGWTVNDRSSTAVCDPYRLVRFATVIMGGVFLGAVDFRLGWWVQDAEHGHPARVSQRTPEGA